MTSLSATATHRNGHLFTRFRYSLGFFQPSCVHKSIGVLRSSGVLLSSGALPSGGVPLSSGALPSGGVLQFGASRQSSRAWAGISLVAVAVLVSGLAGCAGLPTAGPQSSEVVQGARDSEARGLGIVLVDATQDIITKLKQRPVASFTQTFGEGQPYLPLVSPGDVLSVTIWETGNGTLFSTPVVPGQPLPPSRGSVLPNLLVQPDGTINIPYAGRVPVQGLQPSAVEKLIVARLASKASDPQVLVSVVTSLANSVTVGGAVAAGARVPLSVRGDRILDVLATAGGLRISVDDAVILLTRAGSTLSVPYGQLLRNSPDNLYLRGGDNITVVSRPPSFLAFGAVQRNGQIPFDADAISLSEAVAKSAGLSDSRADPEGVFLFRYEDPELMRKIGSIAIDGTMTSAVPVIYRFNFRNPTNLFLARQLMMQDKDILYVSSSPLNDLQKFFNLIGSVLAPASNAAGFGAAAVAISR